MPKAKLDKDVTTVKVPVIDGLYNLLAFKARIANVEVSDIVSRLMIAGLEAEDREGEAKNDTGGNQPEQGED